MGLFDKFKKANDTQGIANELEKPKIDLRITLLNQIKNDIQQINGMNLNAEQKIFFINSLNKIVSSVDALQNQRPEFVAILLETFEENRNKLMRDAKSYEQTNNMSNQIASNQPALDFDELDDFVAQMQAMVGTVDENEEKHR